MTLPLPIITIAELFQFPTVHFLGWSARKLSLSILINVFFGKVCTSIILQAFCSEENKLWQFQLVGSMCEMLLLPP